MRWLSLGKGRFYADVAAILKKELPLARDYLVHGRFEHDWLVRVAEIVFLRYNANLAEL
jgi:hypothetical protein